MQPMKLSEGKLIDINEESDCDRKDEFVPEKVTPAKYLTFKEFSEIFHDTESTKDKMLEVDPNLENSMTILQGIKRCSLL